MKDTQQLARQVRTSIMIGTLLLAVSAAGITAGRSEASPAPSGAALSGSLYSMDTGQPLSGALVEVYPYLDVEETRERHEIGEYDLAPLARATTDRSGRFTIYAPREMRSVLVATAPGHMKTRLGGDIRPTGNRELGSFDLEQGRDITGRVVDASGQPLPGATLVAAVPREPARMERGFMERITGTSAPVEYPVFARSSANGSFVLRGVPENNAVLMVYAPGMAPRREKHIRGGRALTLRMKPGLPIGGTVVAPDGKTSMAGAWVLSGDELGSEGATRTNADGTFNLENQRGGRVTLVAAASIHAPLHAISSDSAMKTKTPGGAGSPPAAVKASLMHAPSRSIDLKLPLAKEAKPPILKLRAGGMFTARALDAETRKALPGVSMQLTAPGEIQAREVSTDESGEAMFAGVPPGTVQIVASADGYFDENFPSAPITVGKNTTMTAALMPAASVEGVVRDGEGRPIAGATISVTGPPPASMRIPVKMNFPIGVDPATSDLQGRFRFEKLPPRIAISFAASSQGYAPWELEDLKLRPGEKRKNMEILLDPGTTLRGRLVNEAGEPVAFASVSAARRPEGGGSGMVIKLGGSRGRRGRGSEASSGPMGGGGLPAVFSDQHGRFSVGGAKDGVWSISVTAKGFAPHDIAGIKIDGGAGVDVGDVTLAPGATITGTIKNSSGEPIQYAQASVTKMFSSLAEATSDTGGFFETSDLKPGEIVSLSVSAEGYGTAQVPGLSPPVENLEVILPFASSVGGQVMDKVSREPITDFQISISKTRTVGGGGMQMVALMPGPQESFQTDDGRFDVDGVDPGKITISASASGYKDAVLRDLDVPEGEDLAGIVLHLDRAAFISGTVRDDRGNPVTGASVSKKANSGGMFGGRAMMLGGGSQTTTDGDGNFLLEGLDREQMTLSVAKDGFEPTDVDVDTTRDVKGLGIRLSSGVTIVGNVLREDDGSPVTGAAVSAVVAGSGFMGSSPPVTTNQNGEFEIEGLSSGRYTIKAEAQGLRPGEIKDVVLKSGAPGSPFEFRLAGGITLTGSVERARPEELAKLTVRAVTSGIGGFGITAPVDASGRFEMKGLSPGNYTLIASTGFLGGRSTSKSVEIPPGVGSMETVIEFPKGAVVDGLVSRGGQAVAGASVVFFKTTSRTTATATTDSTGKYVAEDMDEGDYSVSVMQMETGLSYSTNVSINGDRSFDIELPLARLFGEVRDGDTGEALQGANVSIKKMDGAASTGFIRIGNNGAATDASGYFELDGLEDGLYELTARADGYGFVTEALQIIPGVDPAALRFDLSPVAGYSFMAVDGSSGLPLRSLSAVVLQGGGDPLAPAGSGARQIFRGNLSADASGLFRLGSLQPGNYTLVLGGAGVATRTLNDVQVPGREELITMNSGGNIEVRASGLADDEVARGVLLDEGGRPVHWNTFGAESSIPFSGASPRTLRNIPPGTYTLRVSMPDGAVSERGVAVTPGGMSSVSIP